MDEIGLAWLGLWLKLHLAATVAAVWIPLAAELTAANRADSKLAPALLCWLPPEVRVVLGDRHYNTPMLHDLCGEDERLLVTSRYGRYPHTDAGVEVRRIFHKLRSVTIENFNEHFKGLFGVHGQVPAKGLTNTRRFALGAILVYQLLPFDAYVEWMYEEARADRLHRHRYGKQLRLPL